MNILRFVFNKIINLWFSNKPYSIKRIRKFGKNFLLYINEYAGRKIYLGVYERAETKYLLTQLQADDSCLDIGANMGYYSFLFASIASEVLSVEPIRPNADLIRLTSSINNDKHIEVICSAVSDKIGETVFIESDQSSHSGIQLGISMLIRMSTITQPNLIVIKFPQ